MNNNKELKLKGRVRLVPVADVDTDMIFHNRYLHITDPNEMDQHIFDNLDGWENFPAESESGDILIVGHNFGCGSSRQQAVDGFICLGVVAVVGESFGAIYKRNCINAGLPLVEAPGIVTSGLKDKEDVVMNLEDGSVSRPDGTVLIKGKPLSQVQKDIYFAGGLFELAAEQKNG